MGGATYKVQTFNFAGLVSGSEESREFVVGGSAVNTAFVGQVFMVEIFWGDFRSILYMFRKIGQPTTF